MPWLTPPDLNRNQHTTRSEIVAALSRRPYNRESFLQELSHHRPGNFWPRFLGDKEDQRNVCDTLRTMAEQDFLSGIPAYIKDNKERFSGDFRDMLEIVEGQIRNQAVELREVHNAQLV